MRLFAHACAVAQAKEFKMQRYVANNNRVMGGFMVTIQRHKTKECISNRFKGIGSVCAGSSLKTDRYGLEAVSPPARSANLCVHIVQRGA